MSSLDLANRIILARIIISLGKEHQLLVMTHNVGFYNLIKHLSGTYNTSNDWNYVSLYKFDDNHTIYSIKDDTSVDNLLKDYNGIILPTDLQAVNAMRKKFENLLHEFAKILVIGIQRTVSRYSRCWMPVEPRRADCFLLRYRSSTTASRSTTLRGRSFPRRIGRTLPRARAADCRRFVQVWRIVSLSSRAKLNPLPSVESLVLICSVFV